MAIDTRFQPALPVPASADGDLASPAPAPAAAVDDPRYRAKATEAAVKFESFFIGHMLHQMRSSTRVIAGDDGMNKDSINADMLDMADNLVADQMAGRRAFGIADAILRQLLPAPQPAPQTNVQNTAAPLNSKS
jgi:flagellar protein FlgJ